MRIPLLAAIPLLTLCHAAPGIDNLRLSNTFEARGNQIKKVAISPDDTRVVYMADDDYDDDQDNNEDGVIELYSAPIDGTAPPVKLHADLAPPAGSRADVTDFAITADSKSVVFLLGSTTATDGELYISPVNPPAPDPARIRPAAEFPEPGVSKFLLTPPQEGKPQYVVFNARPPDSGPYRLYSAPVNGRAAPVEIGNGVVSSSWTDPRRFPVVHLEVSLDAQWVAYVAPLRSEPGGMGLFSARVNEEHNERLLNQSPRHRARTPGRILITADSETVVYRSDEMSRTLGYEEILALPIDGSASTPLRLSRRSSFSESAEETIGSPIASRSGNQVAYIWDERNFYTASATAPGTYDQCRNSVKGDPYQFEFIGDSTDILMMIGGGEALRVCSPGGGTRTPVFEAPIGSEIRSFELDPAGTRVAFVADLDTNGVFELYSLPLDGSIAEPVRLSTPRTSPVDDLYIAPPTAPDIRFTPHGKHVIFHAGDGDPESGNIHLFSVPVEGGEEIPLFTTGNVAAETGLTLVSSSPSPRVVFAADKQGNGALELFSVPVDGSAKATKLNDGYAPLGDVSQAWPSPDSQWVVYRADQDADRRFDLYAVHSDGSADEFLPNDIAADTSHADTGPDVHFSSDSTHVHFLANSPGHERLQLFAYNLENRELQPLSPDQDNLPSNAYVRSFRFHRDETDPAAEFLVYLADHHSDTPEFYHVSLASGPVRLDDTFRDGASTDSDFAITPDGSAIVFYSDADTSSHFELFKIDLASGTRTNLSRTSEIVLSNGTYPRFQLALSGAVTIFRTDFNDDSTLDLVLSHLGDPKPQAISGPVINRVEPDFKLTASTNYVVFRADADTSGVEELFSVDLADGSYTRRKLHADLPAGRDVDEDFAVSPKNEHVAFVIDDQLHVADATTAGSAKAVPLTSAHRRLDIATDFAFSPDGNWLVFRSNARDRNVNDLYKVPVPVPDDLQPLEPIATGDPNTQGVIAFTISPDSYRVSYQLSHRAEVADIEPIELFSITLDREGAPTKLNLDDTRHTYTNVTSPVVYLPDASQIIFADDRNKDETAELHTAFGRLQISDIPDQVIPTSGTRTIDITVSDFETRPERITVTAKSDDISLIPTPSVEVTPATGGNGRTLTIIPTPGLSGGPVTVTVEAEANGEIATTTFNVTVGASEYETWIATYLDPTDPRAAFDADPDNDRIPNGAEWATGLHPLLPDAGHDLFQAFVTGDTLTLRHRRTNPLPTSLTTTFESSPDLSTGSWRPFAPTTTTVIDDLPTHQILEQTFTLPSPKPPRLYLRPRYSN